MTKKLLMANEAFAHAALEAGVGVVAGYPGTPSSEVVETVAKLHAAGVAKGVHVEWSTNEKAALEVCIGASLAGKRALFTCKQVGLNVASDSLLSLVYIGVKGGLVLFVADDPGPISSQTEQDTRRFAPFAKVPLLDPSTPEEGAAMIRAAFDLSEKYGTPVIVRSSTRVSHASTFFEVADETCAKEACGGGWVPGESWVTLPVKSYWSHKRILENLDKIAADYAADQVLSAFNVSFESGVAEAGSSARLGIVAGGVSVAYVREALRMIETDAAAAGVTVPAHRFLQVATPYPWPAATVDAFAEGLEDVYVYEELDNVLEDGLHATHALDGARIRGRLTGEAPVHGENDLNDAYARLSAFLGLAGKLPAHATATYTAPAEDALPTRPPVLCPGCPHRGSFYAVKKALGKRKAAFCGDIGCYT
ncbi:MAG: indolepyruvate oxidoreductase, partial [Eggerthellaceae bacterium]|nr:indolepyruvate oxidoreductase [Eggerthellaceae bacterium]